MVQGELVSQRRVLLDVVVDELERLASQGPPGIKDLAVAALGQLDWLGEPVDTDELVAAERVVDSGHHAQRQEPETSGGALGRVSDHGHGRAASADGPVHAVRGLQRTR
jgi:hypothetical protein